MNINFNSISGASLIGTGVGCKDNEAIRAGHGWMGENFHDREACRDGYSAGSQTMVLSVTVQKLPIVKQIFV